MISPERLLLLRLRCRILESYLEFQNPASLKAIEKIRSPTTSAHNIPVTFPESYPFSLVSNLPKSAPNAVGALENKALYNAGLGETAIVFLTLALSSPRKIWLGSLENIMEIEGPETLAAFLIRMFKVGISILSNDAFPSNWMNANILVHKVLIKIMDPIATILEREFVPEEGSSLAFDINLWREAFHLLFKLLSSEQLVIEEFSPQVYSTCLSYLLPLTCTLETAGCVAPCWRHQRGRSRNPDTTMELSRSTSRRDCGGRTYCSRCKSTVTELL